MTSNGVNEHQRKELIEEGKRLGRYEAFREQQFAEVYAELGKLMVAYLGYTSYEEWPRMAKAALKHLQQNASDPRLIYDFKQLHMEKQNDKIVSARVG